jgi:uncharacterized protein (TIGR02996 family)
MSDHDAFLAAITASPDDDTPRLVYADFLEENNEPDRAAFIRDQVRLAQLPPWDPFAVTSRWQRHEFMSGKAFLGSLPVLGTSQLEWPVEPFRRGFVWCLNIRHLIGWESMEARILREAPIGEVHLWHAPMLDDWRKFASSSFARQLKHVHFESNPIEPLRALRESPETQGVTDIFFRRADGAGMPEVVEDLLRSPLGRRIKGLHFRMGYESLHELAEALTGNDHSRLQRLSFTTMGLTAEHVSRLFPTPTLGTLTDLRFHDERLGNDGVTDLLPRLPSGLQCLQLETVRLKNARAVEALVRNERLSTLRSLSLAGNELSPRAMRLLSVAKNLAGLRSLDVSNCRIDDRGLRHLTAARFWRNVVEVNLTHNFFSNVGTRHLLNAPSAPELSALILDRARIGEDSQKELQKKYGEALVLI